MRERSFAIPSIFDPRMAGSRVRPIAAFLGLLLALCHAQAFGATIIFDHGANDSLWGTATNWNPDGLPPATDIVSFGTHTAALTLTLGADRTVNSIIFNQTQNTTFNATNTLTLSTGGLSITTLNTATFNNVIFLGANGTWDLVAGSTVTANGIISGGFGLTKNNGGLLILPALNAFTGNMTINGGFVRAQNTVAASADGAFGNNAGSFIINGGTVQNNAGTFSRNFTVNANGGGLDAFGAARIVTSNVSLATATSILSLGGGFQNGNTGQNLTMSGILSGSGGITKIGNSMLFLPTTNTYSGPTVIAAGITRIQADVPATGNGATGTGTLTMGGLVQVANSVFARNFTVGNGGITLDAYGAARTVASNVTLGASSINDGPILEVVGSYFNASLQGNTADNWLTDAGALVSLKGTRADPIINFPNNHLGTEAERTAFQITLAANLNDGWEQFSVQWDGFITILTPGTILYTRSDDGSRLAVDTNGNNLIETAEYMSNGFGGGQGATTRPVSGALAPGRYRIRIQYYEGGGGDSIQLAWSDATANAGVIPGPAANPPFVYVVPQFANTRMRVGGYTSALRNGAGVGTDGEGQALTMTGNITGGAGMTKVGTSALTLSGTKSYSGDTIVEDGLLTIDGNTPAVGNSPIGVGDLILNGGSVSINATIFGRPVQVTAKGGSLAAAGGPRTFSSPITLATAGAIPNGLSATIYSASIRNATTTDDDWRDSQIRFLRATRIDGAIQQLRYPGTTAERANYFIGGTDVSNPATPTFAHWDNFSFQWDGFITVPTAGTTLYTRSDDGSRAWVDIDNDGIVDPTEFMNNALPGGGQAPMTRAVSPTLPAGTYRIRVQYEEGTGQDNEMTLAWSDTANSGGQISAAPAIAAPAMVDIVPSQFLKPVLDTRLTLGGATDMTLTGLIDGTGSITKSGTSRVTLTQDNTYAGTTTVSAGTLIVNGALPNTTATTVMGGTLGGTGTIASAVTVANGATLSPGDTGVGTLTTGAVTFNATSNMAFDVGTPLNPSDLVTVNGNLTLDGTLNVANAGGLVPGAYTIFTYTGTLLDNGVTIMLPIAGTATLEAVAGTPNKINLVIGTDPTPLGPTVTVNQGAVQTADPTKLLPITFDIVVSERVVGFTSADISIATFPGASITLTGPDGSGLLYTATVTGGVTDGPIVMSIAAGGFTDFFQQPNSASTSTDNSVTYDTTAPVITVSTLLTNDNTPTVAGTVNDTTASISIVVNAVMYTGTNNGDGTWTANVTNALSDGVYDVAATATDIATNVASDATGNELTIDTTAPAISTLAPANNATNVDTTSSLVATFNENIQIGAAGNVTVRRQSDNSAFEVIPITDTTRVSVSNATLIVNPLADLVQLTTYYIEIDAGSVLDLATNPFPGITGSTTWKFTTFADAFQPTVVVSPTGVNVASNPIPFTLAFSENVLNLVSADMIVTNGTGVLSGGPQNYTLNVTPAAQGNVTVQVPASVAEDGSGNLNKASNVATVLFDSLPPVPVITPNGTTTNTQPIALSIDFGEPVTGFVGADVQITNGTLGSFSGINQVYSILVVPAGLGPVTVTIPAGVAFDRVSLGNTVGTATVTFDVRPTINGITPASGATSGGTPVTLTGVNFVSGATVTFDGLEATNVTVVNANTITAQTPPHAQGVVSVVVSTPSGLSSTLTNGYTYALPPTVTSPVVITPAAPIAGVPITVTVSATSPNGGAITVTYNYGDGSVDTTGSHVYTSPGTFTLVVTISDGLATTTLTSVITVAPSVSPSKPFTALKVSGSVKFGVANGDAAQIQGLIPNLAPKFNFAGKTLVVDVGGAAATFTLDAKGSGKIAGGSVKLKPIFKRNSATKVKEFLGGNVPFTAKYKGTFSDDWANEEIVPQFDRSKFLITMPVSLTFDGQIYTDTTRPALTSKKNKNGKFTFKRL